MIEVFGTDFAARPWPVLHRLRDEGGVHRVRTPDGPAAWLVTRYGDVRAGLADSRFAVADRYSNGEDYQGFPVPTPLNTLQNANAADHLRVRRTITAEFSPRRLAQWTQCAPESVDNLIASLSGGEVDLVTEFAVPLPAAILGQLLGLGDSERETLLGWANSTLVPADGDAPRARDTLATMRAIIEATIDHAHSGPTDTVLARFVAGYDESSSQRRDELVALLFYMLFVWYEVLVDLISGAVLTLLCHPEELRVFRADAQRQLAAVDELLRYLSPQVLAGPRFATVDVQIGDHTIRAGQTVLFCLAGANHDPDHYDDPERLDLAKPRSPHTALGYGIHACLGTALVRTVAATTLDRLFTRWPDTVLAVPEDEIRWRSGFRHRGPYALPLVLA